MGKRGTSKTAFIIGLIIIFVAGYFFWPKHGTAQIAQQKMPVKIVAIGDLPKGSTPIPAIDPHPTRLSVLALSSILVDADTGTVLYSENPQQEVAIASTTKLMTAILARKYLDLNKTIVVSPEDAAINGSKMGLRGGEGIDVESLLYGLLLNSGNDAAMTLARSVAGTPEKFVAEMNAEANVLGMAHTRYQDPAGLNDSGYSTAWDLSIVARALLNDPVLAKIVQTKTITVKSVDGGIVHTLKNANHLVSDMPYAGVIGFKTGYTPAAGHCLVAGAERDGHRLIAIVLHTNYESITASAIESRKLLDWGWKNISWSMASD